MASKLDYEYDAITLEPHHPDNIFECPQCTFNYGPDTMFNYLKEYYPDILIIHGNEDIDEHSELKCWKEDLMNEICTDGDKNRVKPHYCPICDLKVMPYCFGEIFLAQAFGIMMSEINNIASMYFYFGKFDFKRSNFKISDKDKENLPSLIKNKKYFSNNYD